MPKAIKIIIAIVVIIFLYMVIFGAIGSLVGWDNRPPMLAILGFMVAAYFIWRLITKKKPEDK